jgi:hypothetical protein
MSTDAYASQRIFCRVNVAPGRRKRAATRMGDAEARDWTWLFDDGTRASRRSLAILRPALFLMGAAGTATYWLSGSQSASS